MALPHVLVYARFGCLSPYFWNDDIRRWVRAMSGALESHACLVDDDSSLVGAFYVQGEVSREFLDYEVFWCPWTMRTGAISRAELRSFIRVTAVNAVSLFSCGRRVFWLGDLRRVRGLFERYGDHPHVIVPPRSIASLLRVPSIGDSDQPSVVLDPWDPLSSAMDGLLGPDFYCMVVTPQPAAIVGPVRFLAAVQTRSMQRCLEGNHWLYVELHGVPDLCEWHWLWRRYDVYLGYRRVWDWI